MAIRSDDSSFGELGEMNKRPLEEPRMRTSRWKMVELIMSELEYVDMKVLAAMR